MVVVSEMGQSDLWIKIKNTTILLNLNANFKNVFSIAISEAMRLTGRVMRVKTNISILLSKARIKIF